MSRSSEYRAWIAMNQRCYNKNNRYYHRYGGRGIEVCTEWRGKGGFLSFYQHIGPRPTPQHSLGRIDNNGNYVPGNVRWETVQQQSTNTVRCKEFTIGGATKCIAEWARIAGVDDKTMARRIEAGWPTDRLLSPPEKHQYDHLVNGKRLITIEGRTQSVTEWSEESGINVQTIRARLRKGLPPYRLLSPVRPKRNCFRIGSVAKSLKEWAGIAGISVAAFSRRISNGWPEHRLLDPPQIDFHQETERKNRHDAK